MIAAILMHNSDINAKADNIQSLLKSLPLDVDNTWMKAIKAALASDACSLLFDRKKHRRTQKLPEKLISEDDIDNVVKLAELSVKCATRYVFDKKYNFVKEPI